MNEQYSTRETADPRPALTLALVMCGLLGAVAVGNAGAATVYGAVPQVVVRYQPASLTSEAGTKALYRRLVNAAEQACPVSPGTRLISEAVQECRIQAVARAVQQIGNPALAAVHAGNTKRG